MSRTLLLPLLFAAACSSASAGRNPDQDLIKRGELLVSIGGCNDCHTPMAFDPKLGMPVPQMNRLLSGHPEGAPDPKSTLALHDQAVIGPTFTSFLLPFGVVYAANLTPDKDTGLGSWNEQMFIRAMRTGRHFGGSGRPILPPMPWMGMNKLPDSDLKAIFAYLRSIPAIHNGVHEPKIPQPVLDGIAASYDKILSAQAAK